MTFVLRELSDLRKHFDDTVQIILKREHKGKIEDLTNPQRKFEFQFLNSILVRLEEQAKDKSHGTPVNLSNVFYGAMLTVMQDIENNRGMMESSGLLNDRLKDLLGMSNEAKADEKPDVYQTANFHTALNTYLSQVFIENDSRKGFAKNHMLTGVPTDSLNKLIQTSYKLEKEAQRAIVAAFAADGKATFDLSRFKPAKRSPESAFERFGGWEKINADMDELIKDELADKNVSKIEKLKSRERMVQLHFLNATRDSLKASSLDKQEKTAILAGAMHLVRQQILNEYAASYVSSSEKSVIYKGLNKLLGVDDEVCPQDIEALATSAGQYIQFVTIDSKASGKKSIRSNHIFSSIPDFNLKNTFNLFIDLVYTSRIDALNKEVEKFKKETQGNEKAAKGYLEGISSALGLFRAKKEDDEEEDDVLEHTASVHAGK